MTQFAGEMQGLADMLDALPEQVVRYRLPDLSIVDCNSSWAAWYDGTCTESSARGIAVSDA